MILTANPVPYTPIYTPLHSSPLSERSVNAVPRPFRYASAIMSSSSSNMDAQKSVPFSKRAVKTAPVIKDRDAVRERRRDLFLKKVSQNRDEKKWAQRGDQILRLDCLKEQKRWEADKARAAPTFEQWLEEDEQHDTIFGSQQSQMPIWSQSSQSRLFVPSSQTLPDPSQDAEALAEMERQELEELTAMMDEDMGSQQLPVSHFGSDNEDYESLFMDMMSEQENQIPQFDNHATPGHQMAQDDMDMDMS